MAVSLQEIVFLFTVSGHRRCGCGGAPGSGRFLTVSQALPARRDASPGFLSLLVSTSGRAPFVSRSSICIQLQIEEVEAGPSPAPECAAAPAAAPARFQTRVGSIVTHVCPVRPRRSCTRWTEFHYNTAAAAAGRHFCGSAAAAADQ